MQQNRITELFGIDYSIIQGGMVWVSGYKLASAVSNAGGLGLIGAGSMYPEVFRAHIQKCQKATNKPFGVNIPLMYPDIDQLMQIVMEEGVKIVFTSAGNPNLWTAKLQSHGIKVVHVVSSIKFALKAQEAGVNAVVAEGFEAGGHNGREETTTFTLIPMVKEHLSIPLIAAGGIATGRGILAAEVLGADGVQIGSRFAVSQESSAHIKYKELITELQDGATQLTFKELAPVRIVKNNYYQKLLDLYKTDPTKEIIQTFYDEAKLKTGIFEGDVTEGKIEIGQIAGLIHQVKPVAEIMDEMITAYNTVKTTIKLNSMTNNDAFRRLKYIFNYNPEKIILLFNHVGVKVEREEISKWLEKDTEEVENLSLSDEQFASFLNGMIVENRGKKDGQVPVAEKELNNNIVFRKLRIALNLKDTDILELIKSAGLNFGKSELSAFFRKPTHQHYKECQDQVLRNFLNGLFLKHQDKEKK